jgi:uncharacterized membrane protein YdjX (TVP38/TMEM64 family)
MKHFLIGIYSRSLFLYLAMGIVLILIIMAEGREIKRHIDLIEFWVKTFGIWGIFAFIGFYILATSFLLPETLLAILAGSLFGLAKGLITVVASSLIASAIQYLLSYYILRSYIQQSLAKRPVLAAIQKAVQHNAFRLQVLLRLTPLNPATISYVLGAAGVRFPGFIIACLSLIPALFIEVYFGHTGKHIAQMVGRDSGAIYLHDLMIIGGFLACAAIAFFLSKIAHNAILEVASGNEKH